MGGYVAKGRHEELIAYFGYPEAQEDASERAVRAGLAIQQAMTDLNARLGQEQDVRFEVRCAIHAGTVVVTQSTAEGAEIFGDTPEIAAKARAAASPDTVVMTAVVHDLVSGLFVIEDLGDRAVVESGDTQRIYRVVRPGLAGSRPRGFSPRETSPFVGRDDELALLMGRWRCVQDGEGQFVLVTGEPGIGKSRLVEEFRTRMKGDPHLWISCGGGPLFTNTPLHPVVRMLDQGLGWRGDESPEERLSGLERALRPLGARTAEAVPLIAGLLNLPTPGGGQSPMFAPDQARRRLLEALAAWVFGATRDQPLVAVVEDLHWVDPSTLELIQTLLEQGATAPLMLLCTARPEFRPTWTPRGHHAHITLNRLNNRQTRELVSQVVARSGLVKDVVERVLRRTDGVPLFAEELTRLMLEGDEAPEGHAVPATLLDSLAARLDRVGRAKETAQLASVIGREFSYELLRAVSQASDADLDGDLARLADAELIYARGLPPHASYQFKHALMQDAAYQTLLKSTRRELHGRVARTLAERFPALADAQPEILARHWTEAGEAAPAIDAWHKAGDAAYARRAFKEAEEDYHQALAIQEAQPESPEGDARTLALLSALNRILQLTRGYAAPETVAAATRARSLAEKTGSISQLIREEAVLWRGIITSGDYAGAAAMADHILDLTHRAPPSPARLLFAHNAQVQTRYYTGDLAGVEEHFALLAPLIESDGRRQAPGNNIVAIGIASLTAFQRGRRTLAETRIASAAAFAEKTGNPYDLAMALHFESGLRIMERDVDRADTLAQRMMEVGEENGFSYIMDLAAPKMGWVRAHQGAPEEGLDLVRRGLAGVSASGARIAITLLYNSLAEIQAMTGAVNDALDVIEVGLNANPQELIFRPEALILRGTFRANFGDMTLAEADFREALALAGRIDSATMALRAALRLAPLMQSRGEDDAAKALIAAHRDRVPDGAGTRVMLEAEAALRAA
jgi:tetratricopeptide (TPR) repeat protein